MKRSSLSTWFTGVGLLVSTALCPRAHAFGGLWSSAGTQVSQGTEKILFVDNPDDTLSAVVQFGYTGPARQFAWVIPVRGTPTVEISSSIVFQRLDAATMPQYWVEVGIEDTCMPREDADNPDPTAATNDAGYFTSGALNEPAATDPQAATIEQGSVGPYDYVTLTVDPTLSDPAEIATRWFADNGYALTDLDGAVLNPYLRDGFNLLAFKLSAGADAGAIRPVTLTYESKLPMIPLRPTALAAQTDVGIQVWVIGPAQAVPINYKALVLNEARIDWLNSSKFRRGTLPAGGVGPFGPKLEKPRNYNAVVTSATHEGGGQGFVTELGGPASQYRDKIWSALDEQQFATLSGNSYADGIDAVLAALSDYAGWDGFREAVQGATHLPEAVNLDDFVRDPAAYRGLADVDSDAFFQLLEEKVLKPVSDTALLLYKAPYLTRLYSVMSPDAMTVDPVFDYNADLAQLSNVHIAKQTIECSSELQVVDAPWHIALPQGGLVVGQGGGDWPVANDALPANLKVVELSTNGPGKLVQDNSQAILAELQERAGSVGSTMPQLQPPKNGVMIGGTQPNAAQADPMPAADGQCSVSRVGGKTGSGLVVWLSMLACVFARRWRRHGLWLGLFLASCDSSAPEPKQSAADGGVVTSADAMTLEQLRDPETCQGCHPTHYREWSSSMHAYAAQDPVFLAMNKRGQRETNGALGDFCIKCHAPMAVYDKRSSDGLNLDQLPDKQRGVSCYFCHNVAGIEGDHNGLLKLANDTTMRGPIRDPLQPGVHRAEFSELFEDTSPKSTALCGGCHDVVTPSGVNLERTLQEYNRGIFSKSATGEPPAFDSCVGCHMPGQEALAAIAPEGTAKRIVHEHLWPGIDLALTHFPNRAALRSAVEDCQLGATSFSFFKLEVTPPDLFTFQLETNAGHNQPSGSAQDRRMWLEFMAYDENGALLASSGNIADAEIEDKPKDDPKYDPNLVMFRDHIYDAQGKPVHMFWDARKSKDHPEGYESHVLPVADTTYIEGKHAVIKQFRASGPNGLPARVTARLRARAIGMDVLQDLVKSGDLDPAVVAELPTLDFGAQIEWTPKSGVLQTISAEAKSDCSTYRCLLEPGSPACLNQSDSVDSRGN